ncbi:hypothetical protein K438DRAFT_2131359 [Mycena galopus ATCC 62051]|nr:hypothetical protein K438DRAFT_2131359 [Mycena galopus ATCC 62051]
MDLLSDDQHTKGNGQEQIKTGFLQNNIGNIDEPEGPRDGIQSGRKVVEVASGSCDEMISQAKVQRKTNLPSWAVQHQDDRKQRKFEPEDGRHPESGGLSQTRLTFAKVRVGDPANMEGMNRGGRELEVQRKSWKKAKVKEWSRQVSVIHCSVTIVEERTIPIVRPEVVNEIVAELFRLRNLLHVCSTVEPERTGVREQSWECGDETRGWERHYVRLQNKIHNGEPEDRGRRLRWTKSQSNETSNENGEVKESRKADGERRSVQHRPMLIQPAGQCRRGEATPDSREKSHKRRDRKSVVIFPLTNVGAGKPGSSSDNGSCRKGEGKQEGMPEQLPEEITEGKEDAEKDVRGPRMRIRGYLFHCVESGKVKIRKAEVKTPEAAEYVSLCNPIPGTLGTETITGIATDIAQAPETLGMAEVQGYAGYVKSKKDTPGSESKVDFTCRKFAGTMSVIVHRVQHQKPEPERTGEFGWADKLEEPIVPEVVSANLPEESKGGSELGEGSRGG